MKKHLLSLMTLFLLLATTVQGQSYIISENFEGTGFPPAGWTTLDHDGDGHGWQIGNTGLTVRSGRNIALSYSSDPASYPPVDYARQENYLITPAIHVTNNAFTLEAYYAEEDIDSEDSLEVRISTKTTAPVDFTDVLASVRAGNPDEEVDFSQLNRSLSKYEGQTIYIAFIHKGTGGYAIALDDISVINQRGPQRVSALTATAGGNGGTAITLSWTNPTKDGQNADLGNYQVLVYRDNALIATLPQATTTYTDSNAPTGQHTYAVSIKTDEGESRTRTVTAYAGEDTPASVTGLHATIDNGQVTLAWSAPLTGAKRGYINPQTLRYSICKTVNSGSKTTVSDSYADTTYTEPIADGDLTTFYVAAFNSAGVSDTVRANAVVTFAGSHDEMTAGAAADNATSYTMSRLPIDAYSRSTVSETLYFPEEFHYAKGEISGIVYRNAFGPNTVLSRPLQIYIGEVSNNSLADGWVPVDSLTKVYDGPISMSPGVNDIPLTFSTPYLYKGGNLVLLVYGTNFRATGSYVDHFMVAASPDHAQRSLLSSGYSDIDLGSLPSSPKAIDEVPYTRFVMNATGVGALSGTITDATSGKGIAGATISIKAYNLTTTTDASGHYRFAYVPTGSQTVSIGATGYEDSEFTTAVTEDGTTADIKLESLQPVTYSGRIVANDTDEPLANAAVKATGYDNLATTTADDGTFTLNGLYAGKAYIIKVEKSNFNIFTDSVASADNTDKGTISLQRSIIPAYGVEAAVAGDGGSSIVSWRSPYSRTGRIQWTTLGNSAIHSGTSGDNYYSPDDYSVAHYWDAAAIADSAMTGQSFLGMRVWLQASAGTFTAHVWQGNRDIHQSVAEKEIALSDIPAEGGWVDVTFDNPVEIKAGQDYMVGVNAKGASSDPFGVYEEFGQYINGRNNVKFTDMPGGYSYNGYYAWNIAAHVGIPGADLPVDEASATVKPTYVVLRHDANDQWTRVGTTADTTLADNQWASLPSGRYYYRVEAVYAADNSIAAYSDTLTRSIDTDAGVAAIVSPKKSLTAQTSVTVTAYVKNYGEKPLTAIPVALIVNGEEKASTTFSGNLNKGDSALVNFSNVALEANTVNRISVATRLDGDKATANDTLTIGISNLPNVVLHAFRWNIYESQTGPITINTNNPEATTLPRPVTPNDGILGAGAFANGRLYGFTTSWQSVPEHFVGLDPVTWTPEVSAPTEDFLLDMSYNPQDRKMYGIAAKLENGKTLLVNVDLDNGSLLTIDTLEHSYHAFAIDKSGEMYGLDRTGRLYTFHHMGSVTAETLVGYTGVPDVRYFQSMTFDVNTGRLFWVHSGDTDQGRLYEIDPATAATTDLGLVLTDGQETEAVALYTIEGETTGITNVHVDADDTEANAPRYNLKGQRVNADYKGITIVKGRKFVTK